MTKDNSYDPDMVAYLLKKKSDMQVIASKTGKNTEAASKEAGRQLLQKLRNGVVTKSGEED